MNQSMDGRQTTPPPLSRWRYAALGLPLAMVALPVYLQTPKLYGGTLGMNLTLLGLVLLVTRLFDALQDPWLGRLSDRLSRCVHARWRWLALALLALGLLLLFNPPQLDTHLLPWWLVGTLLLVYVSYSLLQIDYLAWGGSLSCDPAILARYSSARESAAVVGVLFASGLPALLSLHVDVTTAYALFSLLLALVLAGGACISFNSGRRSPAPPGAAGVAVWHNRRFVTLAGIYLLNCLANALPATLVLFFIADVLQLEAWSALFLLLYFGAALIGLPLWMAIMRQRGLVESWRLSLLGATLAFCWALTLGAGDGWQYGLICVLAGLALGGDLALPPALLAHQLEQDGIDNTGPFYGWWTLLSKAGLALAAGAALPLLDAEGYRPGGSSGVVTLSLLYAGLPCVIKVAAAILLTRCSRPGMCTSMESAP